MKAIANVLIAIGLVCYITAVISKLSGGGLYNIDIKPLAGLTFGNSCLLLALVLRSLKE